MTHVEIWLMALALAMDCFAVSVASGIIFRKTVWRPMLAIVFLFGFFQAFNTLLGFWGASHIYNLIKSIDHWIAFAILGFLGTRMIMESFKDEEEKSFNPSSYKVIFTLAIATSIDALAVGISYTCMGYGSTVELAYPITAIGITSSLMSAIGLYTGMKFGKRFAGKLRAELWGGIILIIIGIKIFAEHICAHGIC